MPEPLPVSIDLQAKEVAREVALRRSVYAKRVRAGKMEPQEARDRLDTMEAVGRTLAVLRAAEPAVLSLLSALGYASADSLMEVLQGEGAPSGADGGGAGDGQSRDEPVSYPALLIERLEMIGTADLDTLRRWWREAQDWPQVEGERLAREIEAEAALRPDRAAA